MPSGERRRQLGRGSASAGTTTRVFPVATSIAASVALFSRMKCSIIAAGVAPGAPGSGSASPPVLKTLTVASFRTTGAFSVPGAPAPASGLAGGRPAGLSGTKISRPSGLQDASSPGQCLALIQPSETRLAFPVADSQTQGWGYPSASE